MFKVLGVGIIGASAERGWAKEAHVPAVKGLEGLQLTAVAAGSETKAKAAAEAFGASAGYASGFDLINDPAVDIVTVAVKVPDHRELVEAAIAAGKHIYCEWPLGKNFAETKRMADLAEARGVRTAIGLQMRSSSAVLHARKALQEGRIGRPLTARIVSNTAAFGPAVESAMEFSEDAANGVTLVTIQGAHTFDLAIAVLGGFAALTALATTQYPQVSLGNDPVSKPRTISDHVFLQAQLESGASLGVEVAGGRPPEAATHFEVIGTEGTLALRGGAMRGVQSGRLQLLINEELQPIDEGEVAAMPDSVANVAGIYAMLRDDIRTGAASAPDFQHAVALAQLVDDAMSSSKLGVRKTNSGWPTK